MINPIDKGMTRAENVLSLASGIPVIGTAAGACKIAMGTVQLATALALAILSAIPALIPVDHNPARDLFKFSCRHVVHGTANVLAGAVEAIPIIQTLFLFVRVAKAGVYSDAYGHQTDEQEGKFIRYIKDDQGIFSITV